MLKKSITFTDFNGEKVTEDHYFHLSKADLVELEMSKQGGLAAWIQRVVESEDGNAIMREFKHLILSAYGKRSEDGRRFVKNEALRDEFVSSEAYSELFMELITDADAAGKFVNGIIPPNLEADVAKLPKVAAEAPEKPDTPRVITREEMTMMDDSELKHLLSTGQAVIGE